MPKRGRPRIQVTKPINIIEVDAEIKLAMKEHDPRYLERLQALKYLAQNKSRERVSQLLDKRQETILDWIHLWNTGGFRTLRPVFENHRPCRLTSQQILELKMDLRQPPETFGLLEGGWTGKNVIKHIKDKFGITYHLHSITKALRSWGITSKVPRPISGQQDPKKVEIFLTQTVPALAKKKNL